MQNFSDFGTGGGNHVSQKIHMNTGYTPVSQSLNFAKNSNVFATNQVSHGNILNTDGNKSMAGMSNHGDIQRKDELIEQQTYKRQLHSNMTSRVLNM